MPFYENHECPVCKKKFEQGDEIVVCPDCGTPHHRECYNLIGHCVNYSLHKNGYDYYKEINPVETETPNSDNNKEQNITNTQNNKSEDNPQTLFASSPIMVSSAYDNDTQTIDGESLSDVAATVRTNIPHFVDIFKKMEDKGKKFNWNWGGFVFGSFYLLFRKMYKQGILFICLTLASFFGCSYALYTLAPKFTELVYSIMQNVSTSTSQTISRAELSQQIYDCFTSAPDGQTAKTIILLMPIVLFVFHLIIATLADYFYKGTVVSIIKKVKKQLEEGATFMQTSAMMTPDINLNQEQMKKMYLSRKGGVSLFAPLLAYLVINILITLV
jgi:hypothetical protein